MSDPVRAVALLLSVLLWSPVAPSLLRGGTSPSDALLLYAGALALSLTGCGVVTALVRSYGAPPDLRQHGTGGADAATGGSAGGAADGGSYDSSLRRRREDAPA